jgi:prepilin peptidase CpaA
VSDVRTRRIPNAIAIALGVFGLGFSALMGWGSLLSAVLAGLLVLVIGMLPFSFGWLGGGDVKLLAACACVFGMAQIVPLAVYTALTGGVLALVVAALSRESATIFRNVGRRLRAVAGTGVTIPSETSATRLPYAVAITCAVSWIALGNLLVPGIRLFR